MITGSYSRYSGASSSSSPYHGGLSTGASSSSSIYFTPTSVAEKNDCLIHQVLEAIRRDPLFSDAFSTARQCLNALCAFFKQGGNPATPIPEMSIGREIVKNISCLEFVYRLSKSDFEGLLVNWDNNPIGSLFTEVLEIGLREIDRKTETLISIDQIVDLIRCVFATDSYFSPVGEDGKILNLVNKFLDLGGNPMMSVEDLKFGRKVLRKSTIFELLYLPYHWEESVDPYLWDDEVYEWNGLPAVNDRFSSVIDRCKRIINAMLDKNRLADRDFLPLIRIAIEFDLVVQPKSWLFPETKGELGDSGEQFLHIGEQFLDIMEHFIDCKANPNIVFPIIKISKNSYKDLACFQAVYLILKDREITWDSRCKERLQGIFEALLSDPRIDLTWRFSEYTLDSYHFVNRRNPTHYREKYPEGTSITFFYPGGTHTESFYAELCDGAEIDATEGHSLERITIAHYAAVICDYVMLRDFLDREPRLMTMTCCLTRGKGLLMKSGDSVSDRLEGSDGYWISSQLHSRVPDTLLESVDHSPGFIKVFVESSRGELCELKSRIYRITNVTLLHLAARAGHEAILACLGSEHPNPAAVDSDNRIPQHYLQFSIEEGGLQRSDSSERMLGALKPVTKFVPALPQVNLTIHREGYDLHYDTSGKVAKFVRQRLGRDSFGAAKRTNHRWIDNLDIPELNRVIDNDYKGSGYDRGHLVPAEDATLSDRTMGDTFHPENAVPQNPNLNRGVWSRLEAHVRRLALSHDLVEVFTGPLFVPKEYLEGRMVVYPVIGGGDVHVPTDLFKIILIHDRRTTAEVYVIPNVTHPPRTPFWDFKWENPREGIDFIQRYSGIPFREWMQNRPRIHS